MQSSTSSLSRFSKSPAYNNRYSDLPFGWTRISACRTRPPGSDFEAYRRKMLRKMRKRETLAEITSRIELYDRFFQSFGYVCPLPKHLKRTVHSGFPRYTLMVDVHFMAEMCAGILVAVADYDRFEGPLCLDLAGEGETWQGMGERSLSTTEGEIVLRDERSIVCTLCQGPDEKTRIREDTRDVCYYAYAVPGISAEHLRHGLDLAAEAMAEFGGGTVEGVELI